MSDYREKAREIVKKAGPFRILAVVVSGALLLLLSCGNLFQREEDLPDGGEAVSTAPSQGDEMGKYKEQMESQVTAILEKVEGVGAVDVMITLRASKKKVTLKDNSHNEGKSEEESVLIESGDDGTSPYIVQEREPEIEGILVVCGGGDSPSVQREIIAGISALFPVESHKIKVMKSKEAK